MKRVSSRYNRDVLRLGVAVVCLAGCGRVSFDALGDGRTKDGPGDTAVDSIQRQCSLDDFSAGAGTGWVPYGNPNFTTSFATGQLVISLTANMPGYAGLDSVAKTDFTNGQVSVEVPQVISGAMDTENYILVFLDGTNYYALSFDAAKLHMYRRTAGVDLAMTAPYNATTDRFWRIEHVASTASIIYSTSADGMTWAMRYSLDATLPVTAVQVELGAGEYLSGASNPGSATFDNLLVCLP